MSIFQQIKAGPSTPDCSGILNCCSSTTKLQTTLNTDKRKPFLTIYHSESMIKGKGFYKSHASEHSLIFSQKPPSAQD